MKRTNLHAAKTHLSQLIELVSKGEEVIICKAGRPVAKLVPFKETRKNRKPGVWEGKVTIKKDFDVLPEEFMKHFRE